MNSSMSSIKVIRCPNLPRCRIKLLIILFAILVTILIAAFTREHYIELYKHSLNSPYMDNILDWNRNVGQHLSSTFNMTMHAVKRLSGTISNLNYVEPYGYVLAISFSGQQGAGVQALMSLQCWAASFSLPIRILEPSLSSTTFVSFATAKHQNSTFVRFSDLFDLQHFNKISKSLGYALVGTRDDFFTAAPRDVIIVEMKSIPRNASRNQRIPKVVWTANSEPNGDHYCYQLQGMHNRMEQLAKENFCVVRIIKATYSLKDSYIFSDTEVRKVIYGDRSPQHVTLIFSFWRTPWYVANNELDDPHKCKHGGHGSSKDQFMPSPRLMADVKYYEKHFLNSNNNVAVMLRIEHMMEFIKQHQNSTKKWTVDECLTEVFRTTQEKLASSFPMVTLDLGKFGSGTLKSTLGIHIPKLTEKSKLLLTSLFDNKLTFEEWEESFTKATGGVEHSGYIAALQRTLASRAKCLILVGGGSFQDLALKDYIKYYPNKSDRCVEFVCVKKEETFMELIDNL